MEQTALVLIGPKRGNTVGEADRTVIGETRGSFGAR